MSQRRGVACAWKIFRPLGDALFLQIAHDMPRRREYDEATDIGKKGGRGGGHAIHFVPTLMGGMVGYSCRTQFLYVLWKA